VSVDVAQAGTMLMGVQASLTARNPRAAIKLFEEIIAGDSVPAAVRLPDWIASSIGREGLSRLALAYATAACSYCKRGRRECSVCDGIGRGKEDVVCPGCLGMRRQPCATCQGSGLASYGHCPDDLRSLVLSYRLCIAASGTAKLVPEDNVSVAGLDVDACLRRIANLNKLTGVLETAAVELAGQQARGMISPARLERVKGRIVQTYDVLDPAIRAALDRIVELTSLKVGNQNPDVIFYRDLARSDRFEGTSLHRNFAARLALGSAA
jgi:hypothetical protein